MASHYRYLISRGRPGSVPQRFHLREQVWSEHLFYWDAFWDLSSARQMGMSVGPIPYTALLIYAQEKGLHGERYEMFRRLIRAMDAVFMQLAMVKPEVNEDD